MTHRSGPIAVRFDKNAVMLFDRRNGTKMRFSLGPYRKASKPELVDISVSDYCSAGCAFCYRGSTIQGKHATMEDMEFIIEELARVKVPEVAMGGGEPLQMPEFPEVVRKFSEAGVVPNFTTKFPGLVTRHWGELAPYVGGFAYSAETAAQVRVAKKVFTKGGVPDHKVNLHYVMGLGEREHFEEYLRAANEAGYRVTLLGYKTTGRGKEVIPHPYDWWIDSLNTLVTAGECPSVSIDTPLAEQYREELPVEGYQFHTREGFVSMFIDAVSMEMGASSFDEKETLVPFNKNWRKKYRKKSFARDAS